MGTIKRTFANNVLTDGKIDATDLSGTIPASNIANASVTAVTALPSALGDAIESVATDPVSPSEGQLWYNTTIGVLKVYKSIGGAWASGGTMATARTLLGGSGTQTAGLGFGGYSTTSANTVSTEEYDGSVWAAGGNLNTGRYTLAGAGTQTAGLAFGGATYPPLVLKNSTEEYDGSAWTNGGNLGTARRLIAGTGIQTSGLAFAGISTAGTTAATEEYTGAFTQDNVKTITTS